MASKRRIPWSRDELIVALNLYALIPFGKVHSRNKEVIKIAELLDRRTAGAVAMCCTNFASQDPLHKDRGVSGLSNISKDAINIWNEFYGQWGKLSYEAHFIEQRLMQELEQTDAKEPPASLIDEPGRLGTDVERTTQQRRGQDIFRRKILVAYDSKCCITGINEESLLVASHIKTWAASTETERLDLSNGLCLNALHDKAFDRGLITVSEDPSSTYKIYACKAVLKSSSEKVQDWIGSFHQKEIKVPDKVMPKKEYLQWHADSIFKG